MWVWRCEGVRGVGSDRSEAGIGRRLTDPGLVRGGLTDRGLVRGVA